MHENLKKPSPSDAAQFFLKHKLDVLTQEVTVPMDNYKATSAGQVFKLTSQNTYRDMLPKFLEEERFERLSDFEGCHEMIASKESFGELLKVIDLLYYKPVEEVIEKVNGWDIPRAQKKKLLKTLHEAQELLYEPSSIEQFFEVAGKVATKQPLPLGYKKTLQEGYEVLCNIESTSRALWQAEQPVAFKDIIASAREGRRIEERSTHDIDNSLKDPFDEEETAKEFATHRTEQEILSKQISQIAAEAKKMLAVIAPDISLKP